MKNSFLTRANNRNETFFEKIKLENFLKCLRSNFQGFSDFLEEHHILSSPYESKNTRCATQFVVTQAVTLRHRSDSEFLSWSNQ